MSSSPLPNYLLANRKRLALSQEEVAFLLGFRGESKGAQVSREEAFIREPSLRSALAYAVIYQKPVSELFAGLRAQIEQEVKARAKILTYRKEPKTNQQTVRKREALASLIARQPEQSINQEQP